VSNPTPIPTDLITSEQAYRNFIDACRSPKTRYLYKKSLDYFMSYRIPEPELCPVSKEGNSNQGLPFVLAIPEK
jgi:hypothetical protein